jgi:TatD DNase family protein
MELIANKETTSTPPLVDTHAHICDASFDVDRGAVLARAQEAGVGAIVAVVEDLNDARKNLDLAVRYPMLRPAAGLYPAHADPAATEAMVSFIRANRDRLWAIGEVGLDFWIAKTDEAKALQQEIFSRFIRLSIELDLPVNVHSRSAGRHAVDILLANGARRVHLHAFDGKMSAARPAVEAGYFFSIPPSIARSRQKQKLVGHLPLACLLAETDSPVLGIRPRMRNEPAHLMTAVRAIAEIKKLPEKEVVRAVGENARNLYRL